MLFPYMTDINRCRTFCGVVIREWLPEESVTATHIFAYHHGQDIMDAIFGKGPKNTDSLFSAENGYLK